MAATNHRKTSKRYTAFLLLCVVLMMGIGLLESLLRLVDGLGPQIGDVIAFPATQAPLVNTASFSVSRAADATGTPCTLDVPTMQKSGGSLVVVSKQYEPNQIFQAHWAGRRTSNEHDDCGDSAELLLNSNQLSALIFAAGGKGVKAQN